MAKGNASGGRGLSYTARLNVSEAIKEAQRLKKELASIGMSMSGSGKAFDSKPLTEYQAAQLKIKQEAQAIAKAKSDQAAAEKSASLAYQAALRNERLAREAVNTQIAKNRLEQQQANIAAKEQAALQQKINAESNKRRPTQVSNSQAEIDAYNKAASGSSIYTSAINAQVVARARLNAEAAKQAVSEGTLRTSVSSSIAATQTQVQATQRVTLSKKQLAQMLAEEKLRQAESTKELKNNAREMMNAKGSIEQRKAALERLITAYKRMSDAERNTAAGMRMNALIKDLGAQINKIDPTKIQKTADFFGTLKDKILGVLGPLALLLAAWNAIKEAFTHNVEISDNFVDVQRTAKFSADEVDRLGEQLKKINTRTNLEGLLDIGFEGGRLGVKKAEIFDFIKTVDQLAVVLKKEIGGGAQAVAESLGKIAIVFKLSENEGITLAEAMSKVGSAQLDLAHSGPVTVKYLQDFTLGMAGTATAAKLSLPVIEAYGAVLGGSGQIASSAALSLTRLISGLSTKREKYFAIAQLADANLTLEQFTDTINKDAKSALDLFFKGLTAGNPVTTELDDRLKSVGITTGKVSNSVKILAKNQDLLAEKIAIGTKGYEENTSISHNFELANNSLAASFDKIKNSISNAFTDSSFSRGLASLVNSITDNRTESEKLSMAYEDNKHASDELTKTLDPLVKRYEELKSKGKLNTDEQTELRDIIVKIAEIIPDSATALNKYGEALDINAGKVREFTKAQKESLELQNREALKKAHKEFEDADAFLKTAVKVQQGTNKAKKDWLNSIMDFGGGDSEKRIRQKAKDDVTETLDIAYKAAVAVRKLNGELSKAERDIIARFEKPKVKPKVKEEVLGTGEGTEEDVLVMDVKAIKKEIKSLTEANIKLGNTGKQFELNVKRIRDLRKQLKEAGGGVDNSGAKAENEYQTAVKARNTLQEKISELIKKGTDKQLSADEQELESVKNKYDEMRKAAVKFNNDPGNKKKGLRVDAGGLVVAQSNEEDAVRDKQDTEKLKVKLDAQKKVYADFESYKAKLGEKEAKEKFKDRINTEKTYLQNLQSQLDAITSPQKNKGGSEEDAAAKQLQKKFLEEQIELAKAAEEEKYDNLIKGLISYEQERKVLIETYNTDLAELKKKGALQEQVILAKNFKQNVSDLDDSHVQQLDSYKKLFVGIDKLSEKSARKVIDNAKVMLSKLILSGKVSKELLNQIAGAIGESESALTDRLPTGLINVANALDGISGAVSKVDDEFGKVLSTLGNVLGQVGNIKKGWEDFSKFKNSNNGKGDAFGQLTAGLGIFGAGISIFQTIFSVFDRSRQREEQAAYSRDLQIKQTEAMTRALDRQLQLINEVYGTEKLTKYAEGLETIKQKQIELTGQLSSKYVMTGDKTLDKYLEKANNGEDLGFFTPIFKKLVESGKLVKVPKGLEELRDLLENGKLDQKTAAIAEALLNLDKQAKDTFNALSAEKVGSSLENIADGFMSALTDGTQDFGKSFEDVIQKSIINGFKGEIIRKQLQAFYTQFAELADGGLTKDEIEKLRLSYLAAGEKSKKELEDLEKITGISLNEKKKGDNSETGTLRASLTEETGSKLEGLWRGQYDMTRQLVIQSTERNALLIPVSKGIGELYSIAKANFDVAVQTEANTRRTADNTDVMSKKLDQIITNTKQGVTARGAGW